MLSLDFVLVSYWNAYISTSLLSWAQGEGCGLAETPEAHSPRSSSQCEVILSTSSLCPTNPSVGETEAQSGQGLAKVRQGGNQK